ncbi:MAG: sigma-54-dependent Fis family transcriptional regulator [Burkholderiaceae bacterium]|jgi:two-component system response regulator PilR (NtrC family)|nr:sigma-54-dependent Fis family transcriptional regulator [Burkholderiaceae bacterium]
MPYAIPHILIADDELSMRELLEYMLTKEGYRVSCAENGRKAITMIESTPFDLLICDIRLGDISGLEVLKATKKINPQTVVIMISAYTTTETAVESMNAGAFDFVPKPFNNQELKQTIANALTLKTVEDEKLSLDSALKKTLHFGKIIGNSPKMMIVYEMIRQVAKTTTNILLTGESGTGKELAARAIHDESNRSDKPFVAVNCGGIPETLMESELLGYKKGAFTGANQDKKGLFEVANKGTIFLDEIGELSISLQVKLLRVVQEKAFKPVGAGEDINVDVRIITATNKILEEEVIAGRFREDLFYRLNVIGIRMPSLRERKEDIRLLAHHFLEKYSREMGKGITKLSSYAIDLLNKYDFPGNIRELENLIERSVALSNTNIILPESLAISLHKQIHKRRWIEGIKNKRFDLDDVENGVSLDNILEEIEKGYVEKAMELTRGDKARAAELLKINLRSMRYRLDKLSIKK